MRRGGVDGSGPRCRRPRRGPIVAAGPGAPSRRLLLLSLIVLLGLPLGSPPRVAFGQSAAPDEGEPADASVVEDRAGIDGDLGEAPGAGTLGVDAGDIEEIRITGAATAKLEAQETDSAIAFDAGEIEAHGFTDIADLSAFTPNLEIKTAFAGVNPTLFIRGVGLNDYLSNAQSSVAVYNDGVYMQSPTGQLFQLFDVQAIEVLRGPQGSLYGRNATAGAILIRSRMPSGNVAARSRTTYGRFDQIEQEAALEFPIVENRLSTRLAGRFNRRDGTGVNRCATPEVYDTTLIPGSFNIERRAFQLCTGNADPDTDALASEINNISNWAARGIFALDTDRGQWSLNLHGGQSDPLATQFQKIGRNFASNAVPPTRLDSSFYADVDLGSPSFDPTDGDPYSGEYNRTGRDEVDLFGANLTGRLELDRFTLQSISAIEMNERHAETDSDASPAIAAEVDFNTKSTQLSQDLRGEWENEAGNLRATAGGLLLYESLTNRNFFRLNVTPVTGLVSGRSQDIDQYTLSWGLFANFSWDVLDNVTIDGGIRYNWDRKDFRLKSCAFEEPFRGEGGPVIDCDGVEVSGQEEQIWTALTGDARVSYRPHEQLLLYLKYSHGWKPGQFNGSSFAAQFDVGVPEGDPLRPDIFDPAEPESVDSFELGLDWSIWDDRATLKAAGFVYRYRDLQVFRLRNVRGSPPINELINADDAQIAGVEAEVAFEPIDRLFVNGAFGYLFSRYNRFEQQTETTIPGQFPLAFITTTQDYSGNRLIASPEFSFSGSIRYDFDLGSRGTLTPRLDYTWRSEIYFDPNEGRGYFDLNGEFLPPGTLADDALSLVDVSLSYQHPDGWFTITGWIRNATDEAYKVDGFDISRGFQGLLFVIGQPRTFGVTIELSYQ